MLGFGGVYSLQWEKYAIHFLIDELWKKTFATLQGLSPWNLVFLWEGMFGGVPFFVRENEPKTWWVLSSWWPSGLQLFRLFRWSIPHYQTFLFCNNDEVITWQAGIVKLQILPKINYPLVEKKSSLSHSKSPISIKELIVQDFDCSFLVPKFIRFTYYIHFIFICDAQMVTDSEDPWWPPCKWKWRWLSSLTS